MEIGKLPMRSVLEDMSTWSKLTQVFSQSANEEIFVVGEQDKERIREAISHYQDVCQVKQARLLNLAMETIYTTSRRR